MLVLWVLANLSTWLKEVQPNTGIPCLLCCSWVWQLNSVQWRKRKQTKPRALTRVWLFFSVRPTMSKLTWSSVKGRTLIFKTPLSKTIWWDPFARTLFWSVQNRNEPKTKTKTKQKRILVVLEHIREALQGQWVILPLTFKKDRKDPSDVFH